MDLQRLNRLAMDYVRAELTIIIVRPVKRKTADHEDRPLNNKLLINNSFIFFFLNY